MSTIARRITDYYAAVNELAGMLADGQIGRSAWETQRSILYHLHHEVQA